jgi:hypothetical protein
VPARWTVDTHLWIGSADDPLTVYMTDDDRTRVGSLVAQRTGGELGVSVGVHRRIAIGLDLPLVFAQDRAGSIDGVTGMLSDIGGVGLGDLRLRPKIALLRQGAAPLSLAVIPELGLPTGAGSDYRGDDGVTFTPTLAATRWQGQDSGSAATSPTRRVRPPRSTASTVDDEVRLGLGAAYRVTSAVEAGATATTATAADAPLSSYGRTSVELAAGPTVAFAPRWLGFAVAGAGLREGYGTPDWRLFIGARLTRPGEGPARRDDDRDGIVDGDRCPRAAEDRDGWEDDDGCPDDDNDGDGVADAADRAPDEAEDRDGHDDDDGAPDDDNDGDGVADAADRCPDAAETVNGFDDDDGCPDAGDADGDGRRDDVDACPDAARTSTASWTTTAAPTPTTTTTAWPTSAIAARERSARPRTTAAPTPTTTATAWSTASTCARRRRARRSSTAARPSAGCRCATARWSSSSRCSSSPTRTRSIAARSRCSTTSRACSPTTASCRSRSRATPTIATTTSTTSSCHSAAPTRSARTWSAAASPRRGSPPPGSARSVRSPTTRRRRGRSQNRRVAFVVVGVFGFDVRGESPTAP